MSASVSTSVPSKSNSTPLMLEVTAIPPSIKFSDEFPQVKSKKSHPANSGGSKKAPPRTPARRGAEHSTAEIAKATHSVMQSRRQLAKAARSITQSRRPTGPRNPPTRRCPRKRPGRRGACERCASRSAAARRWWKARRPSSGPCGAASLPHCPQPDRACR